MGTLKGFGFVCDVDDCQAVFFMTGKKSDVCKAAIRKGWYITKRRDVYFEACCPTHRYCGENQDGAPRPRAAEPNAPQREEK